MKKTIAKQKNIRVFISKRMLELLQFIVFLFLYGICQNKIVVGTRIVRSTLKICTVTQEIALEFSSTYLHCVSYVYAGVILNWNHQNWVPFMVCTLWICFWFDWGCKKKQQFWIFEFGIWWIQKMSFFSNPPIFSIFQNNTCVNICNTTYTYSSKKGPKCTYLQSCAK